MQFFAYKNSRYAELLEPLDLKSLNGNFTVDDRMRLTFPFYRLGK